MIDTKQGNAIAAKIYSAMRVFNAAVYEAAGAGLRVDADILRDHGIGLRGPDVPVLTVEVSVPLTGEPVT